MKTILPVLLVLLQMAGCSDDAADVADTETSYPLIGDAGSDITALIIDASINSFLEVESEQWELGVSSGQLRYTHSDGRTETVTLSTVQVDEIINTVAAFPWREQESCLSIAIDGGPLPPGINVHRNDGNLEYSVSDAECAFSDMGYLGRVISCADYNELRNLIELYIPGAGADNRCSEYW